MVQSQFKSPEALAHEEGDSLGSVMGGILFCSSEGRPSIPRRMTPFRPGGSRGPGGIGETFWSQWR